MDRLLTKAEVAERLRVSLQTINQYMRDGLPHIKMGQCSRASVRFRLADLDAWLESRKQGAA